MKSLTKFVHEAVLTLHLENVFFRLKGISPSFLKFIPLHREYQKGRRKIVKRHGVMFDLDISDYMQWHVYAMQTDQSWVKAADKLSDNTIILDIGANCGAFTLPLAHQAKMKGFNNVKIIAFEPNPFIFKQLKKNLALNPGLEEVVELQPIGLGDEEGEFGIVFDPSNSGNGKIVSETYQHESKVYITRLDSFVQQHKLTKIHFIKIDVEGFEPLVLNGAFQLIKEQKPDLFIEITETWFQEKGYSQKMIFEDLSNLGYSIYAEKGEKFEKISKVNHIYSDSQFNILAMYE